MEQRQHNMRVAGIDVGKARLDVAVQGSDERAGFANAPEGLELLVVWLRRQGVTRVGMEATGGYERAVRARLQAEGLEVVVHPPLEVRLFARLKRKRAKTDRIACPERRRGRRRRAELIAAATAQVDAVRCAQDPRLAELAERLSAYEQLSDQAARMKTTLEHVTLDDLRAMLVDQLASLRRLKARLAAEVLARVKAHDDLRARFRLLASLPGFGPIVAASLLVRMPELGSMTHGQAASLAGVAPFSRESGQWKGLSRIAGGRQRVRRMLYIAALAARRCDPTLKAFADRLAAKAKPAKLVLVAVMRKLVEAANLVLARQQPWIRQPN